jgi:hypothetical protein
MDAKGGREREEKSIRKQSPVEMSAGLFLLGHGPVSHCGVFPNGKMEL